MQKEINSKIALKQRELMLQDKLNEDAKREMLERKRVEDERKRVEEERKRVEDERKRVEEERKRVEEEERLRAEEEERKRIEEEKRRAEEELKKQQEAQANKKPPSSVTNGITWVMPCNYVYLSSPYGWRIHPVYGTSKFHSGVDLAAPGGNPIFASRSGTVTIATYSDSAGYYVTVNHGDGFSTSYLHMTHYIVSPGQYVAAGQVLGYVGSTGVSTGNHLHFSIYYNGNTQNPADYINFY